jgi:hypothetical protein
MTSLKKGSLHQLLFNVALLDLKAMSRDVADNMRGDSVTDHL